MKVSLLACSAVVIAVGAALADEPRPSPSPSDPDVIPTFGGSGGGGSSGSGITFAAPSPRPPDTTPKPISVPGAWDRNRDAKDAGQLKGARVLSIVQGNARVSLTSGERVLKPGDVIGPDVVKSIDAGRIVLMRGATAEHPDGDALVVVTVDGQGSTRVRIYSTRGPTRPVQ